MQARARCGAKSSDAKIACVYLRGIAYTSYVSDKNEFAKKYIDEERWRNTILGVFLPILPTVPFYLATVFCFSQSSRKLHEWFLGTELYKKHLKSFVEKKGMLLKTKISIIMTVTLLMGLGFFFMARKGIWIPCVILAVV